MKGTTQQKNGVHDHGSYKAPSAPLVLILLIDDKNDRRKQIDDVDYSDRSHRQEEPFLRSVETFLFGNSGFMPHIHRPQIAEQRQPDREERVAQIV